MARGGIYKSEVLRARNNLLAQGKYPSIDAIRIELGNTGSKSTIQRYMKEIEEDESPRTKPAPSLSEELQRLLAPLAERLRIEALEEVERHRAQHAEATAGAERAMAGLRAEMEALSQALAETRKQAAEAQRRYEDAAVRLSAVSAERAAAQQLAADLQIQLRAETEHRSSIETKYADARRSLEHFREAAKEQREREALAHENQVQFLQQDLHGLRSSLAQAREQLATVTESLNEKALALEAAQRDLFHAREKGSDMANIALRLAEVTAERDTLKASLAAEEVRGQRQEIEADGLRRAVDQLTETLRAIEVERAAMQGATEARTALELQIDAAVKTQLDALLASAGRGSRSGTDGALPSRSRRGGSKDRAE
jgi:chromosome segregation ATPase